MKTRQSLPTIALILISTFSALATEITWINGGGGNWSNPFNWGPTQVPGSNDTAILPLAVTVTVDAPTTVANVTVTNGTLDASAGLTVNGTMNWGFASVGGVLTIATGAVLNILPADYHLMLTCTLTNHGTVAWSGGLLQGRFGTVIYNFGLWDAQTDLTLHSAFGSTVFNNAGTFRKSGGFATGTIQDSTTFNHTGLLEVRTGTLALKSGGNFTGGTTTNAGGVIQLAAGAYTINGTITTTNVQLTEGTLNGVNVLRGELSWVGSDVPNFPSAAVTVTTNSVLHIVTANNHLMQTATLTNYGTVAWSGGLLQGRAGTVIYNFGLWDAQTDLTLHSAFGSTVFNNIGIFRKSGGTGTGTIQDSTTFNHTGLLEVRTGTLALKSGGNFAGGTTTNAGGIIQLAEGAYTIDGTLTTTNVQLTSGTLNGMNILRGELTWVGSNVENFPGASVTVASNSVLHIATANNHLMTASTLTNYGTVAWSGGLVQGRAGTIIHNFGLWDMQTDLGLSTAFGSTTFNNVGTFLKSSGAGAGGISVTFNHTGLLEVRTGILSFAVGGNFTGGTTTNAGGVIRLATGAYTINGTITTTNVQLTEGTLNGVNVLRGEFTWIGSDVENFPSASVTVASNTVLYIVTANNHLMSASTLTNYGTVAWSGGLVQGRTGTVIHNFGLWDAQTDLTLHSAFGSTTFNNVGTFLKSGGAGTGTIQDALTFNHTGLLEVRTGTLALKSGGNFTGGTTTNAGGIIQLAAGAYTIDGTLTTTNVQLTSGTLNGMNILRGELTWVGSNVENFPGASVTVASNSVLHIVTANNHLMSASTLTNYGTVSWSDGLVQGRAGTVIRNFGLWDAQADLGMTTAFGSTTFDNAGTFRKSGGAGNTTLAVTINNTGLLDLRTGTLNLTETYTLAGGALNTRLNSLTDFGRLSLGGSAALGGPLNVTLNGGFIPALSNQFQIISCSGLSGTFTSPNTPPGFDVIYANNGVFLVLTSSVPVQVSPPQLSGSNFIFSFATANGESYTVQRNDDLNTTNWVLHTNFIGNGLPAQIFAPASSVPQRFFRVRSP